MATGGDPQSVPVDDETVQALVSAGWTPPGEDVGVPLMFTYKKACKKIDVSISQLYRLIKAGEIRPLKLGPQIRRITLVELDEYVKRKRKAAGQDSEAA